ncbi:ATP-binding protein [Lutimonas vermicola]|uniref:ATP-binding protein n=1 Tax=Lutimonas vermicola TaxID=414288 RepID=A0ABU9L1H7_9FLAO
MHDLTDFISEETPPKASAMINTFRAFGYNLQTAVADIIDNSISAKAQNIWISYEWKGSDSWVKIEDDGVGMDTSKLIEAMTPGSKNPNDEREISDLGRFGLGLKTSSFSQCKALTVATKRDGFSILKRCWDLDFVNETGKWTLLDFISEKRHLDSISQRDNGTMVLWEKLDRLAGNSHTENEAARTVFMEEFSLMEDHLSLVFHRYIEKKKLKIWVNGNLIDPWDPFMKNEDGSQLIGDEFLDNTSVHVKCYVLPHISKIDSETRAKVKTQDWYKYQGFYIYRNERLLLYGDWLGLFSKNEHYKNARVLIDISNELDHEWKIDIKKATASPSIRVRRDLMRLGRMTRQSAAKIYKFRGNRILLDDSLTGIHFHSVWKASKNRDGAVNYYINKEHPVIKKSLEEEFITKKHINSILKLIGDTTPVEAIIQNYSEKPESLELRDLNKELDSATIQLASRMFESLKISGISKDLAIKQILNIQPFNEFPQLIEHLN